MKKIVFYNGEENGVLVSAAYRDETFWLTPKTISELFSKDVKTINRHLVNIYEEGELLKSATISKFAIVQKEGNRNVDFYNLDAVIAVEYRVNSKAATRFRIWAANALKEYITKGLVLNNDMLKMAQNLVKIIFMKY